MRKSSLIISALVIVAVALGIVFRPNIVSLFSSSAQKQVAKLEKKAKEDRERLAEIEIADEEITSEFDQLEAEIKELEDKIAEIRRSQPENQEAYDAAQAEIDAAIKKREDAQAMLAEVDQTILAAREAQREAGFTDEEDDAEVEEAISVIVQKSTAAPVTSGIVLRGQTAAFKSVLVKAETQGAVISQPLRKGTLVQEGQLLCELEVGTKASAVAEARARLIEAETNNNASAELVKKGFASETQAKSSQALLEAALANLERAETDLENTKIRAPFDGLLESDTAELGDFMQPGAPCANVLALNPIKLVGYATELQISQIANGALAGARLIDGREVAGEVSFASRSADRTTRTYLVEVTVPNDDLSIRDGATADIFIALDGVEGHLLPPSALTLNGDGQLGLRLAQDDVARFYPVDVIRDTAEGIWVTGLPDEADVIVLGQEYVTDGTKIKASVKE